MASGDAEESFEKEYPLLYKEYISEPYHLHINLESKIFPIFYSIGRDGYDVYFKTQFKHIPPIKLGFIDRWNNLLDRNKKIMDLPTFTNIKLFYESLRNNEITTLKEGYFVDLNIPKYIPLNFLMRCFPDIVLPNEKDEICR